MVIASVLSDLIYKFLMLFYPGPQVNMEDWQQFCQSMLLALFIAAGIGLVVFVITARSKQVSHPRDVFGLPGPVRNGIISLWAVTALWAIIYIATVGSDKIRGFLDFNTFVYVVLCGLGAWLLESILAALSCRLPFMCRYRYVTFWGKRFYKRR